VKSPYRWKAFRIITRRRPSRDGVNGGLGKLHTFRPVQTKKNVRPIAAPAKVGEAEGETRELATGVSEARSRQRRGKKTPTLLNPKSQDGGATSSALHDGPPKRSSDGVNHPVPQSYRAEPKTPRGVPATKVASGAGNTRGAGARKSFGWQTSVGRIARLLHREVARPVGENERALARRKSVAPFDAGRGWVEGETVRVHGNPQKRSPARSMGFRS
jgi:hypothetical protein